MRICMVNNSRWEPSVHERFFAMIRQNLGKVLHADTQLDVRSVTAGLSGAYADDFDNPYYDTLNVAAVGEAIVGAAREGFDAIVVTCFSDPCVREARAVVDVPVIGSGEASILFGSMLGRRLGIVATNMPDQVGPIEDKLRRMGMSDRVVPGGIRLDVHPLATAFEKGFDDPQFVAAGVTRRAAEIADDGADVIVIGCCGVGPFCTAAGVSSFQHGQRRIPLIDPVAVSVKLAEASADLRNGIGLPMSPYVVPPAEEVDRARALFGLE